MLFLGTLGIGACVPGGDRVQPGRAATEGEVPVPPSVEDVPEDLRPLVPLALQWGIGDDRLRSDVVDRASGAEKRALFDAFMSMQLTLEEMDFYVDPDAQRTMFVKLRATRRP